MNTLDMGGHNTNTKILNMSEWSCMKKAWLATVGFKDERRPPVKEYGQPLEAK